MEEARNTNTPTPLTRTSSRHHGRRLTKGERIAAQGTFLSAYVLNGNIMLSCKRANIDRSTFYQWLEHDQSFSLQYHQSEKDFADLALAEFVRRGMGGYERPVVSMGKVVFADGKPLMERVVSDTLLAMLVKRHFPEFREKQQVDLTTQAGTPDSAALHTAIAEALSSYPDAKVAVARALVEMEQARERGK